MAKKSLQEKFQIFAPPNKNDDDGGRGWVWAKDGALRARPTHGGYSDGLIDSFSLGPKSFQKMEKFLKGAYDDTESAAGRNSPHRRTDLQERVIKENGGMPLSTAGATDVTNASSGKMLYKGFDTYDLDGADDEYTGSHVDHFYGDASGQDDAGNSYTGFVERNNYLDRLTIAWLSLSVIPCLFSLGESTWRLLT